MQKKIIIIINVDWFFKSHRLPIALAALEKGYQVHLACANTGHFDDFRGQGIICHHVPFSRSGTNPINELKTLLSLFKVLKAVKPDLAHTVTIKPGLYAGLLSKLIKIPAIIFAISGLGLMFSSNKFKIKRALISFLYRLAFSHSNKRIIFQNPTDKQLLLDVIKAKDEDTILIPGSGVDLELFQSPVKEQNDTPVRVAMAARLLRDKGVYDFIAAAKLIKERSDINIKLTLIGGPDPENPSSVTSKEFNLWREEGIVDVLGARDDVIDLFLHSDIVVLPSYYGEGLPKVLIEAAAAGKPVITTDNPGCRAAIIPNKTGLIIPSQSPSELADAIIHLANDPVLREQMGAAGRTLAEQKFCIHSVVNTHLQSYQEVLV